MILLSLAMAAFFQEFSVAVAIMKKQHDISRNINFYIRVQQHQTGLPGHQNNWSKTYTHPRSLFVWENIFTHTATRHMHNTLQFLDTAVASQNIFPEKSKTVCIFWSRLTNGIGNALNGCDFFPHGLRDIKQDVEIERNVPDRCHINLQGQQVTRSQRNVESPGRYVAVGPGLNRGIHTTHF